VRDLAAGEPISISCECSLRCRTLRRTMTTAPERIQSVCSEAATTVRLQPKVRALASRAARRRGILPADSLPPQAS